MINYSYIEVVMRDSVCLTTGEEILVGRTYRTTFHEQYMRAGKPHKSTLCFGQKEVPVGRLRYQICTW